MAKAVISLKRNSPNSVIATEPNNPRKILFILSFGFQFKPSIHVKKYMFENPKTKEYNWYIPKL